MSCRACKEGVGRARENNLVVNEKKCSFGKIRIEYLGHVISGQGVAVDPNQDKSMVDCQFRRM